MYLFIIITILTIYLLNRLHLWSLLNKVPIYLKIKFERMQN